MNFKNFIFILTTLISFASMAQKSTGKIDDKNYAFHEVDSLIAILQPTKARSVLDKKLPELIKKNDVVNIVKGIRLYQSVVFNLEEEEKAQLFFDLFELPNSMNEPAQSIVRTELLQSFINDFNGWFGYKQLEIYHSINFSDSYVRYDFAIKNIQALEDKITTLDSFDFKEYQKLLIGKSDPLFLYRTLGDYLSYQLIDIYGSSLVNSYGSLKHAATDDASWYMTPDAFTKHHFLAKNLTFASLRLFQKIEKNNLNNHDFLSVASYLRLKFLKDKFNNQEEYVKALQKHYDFFERSSARSKFLFSLALEDYNKGKTFHYKNKPEVEGLIKKAHKDLENELAIYPNSDFKGEIMALMKLIEEKDLNIIIPNISASNKRVPVLVKHRNIDEYVLRVYRVTDFKITRSNLREYAKNNSLELVQTIDLSLEHKGLFQERSTELLIGGFTKPGMYFVVASKDKKALNLHANDNEKWSSLNLISTNFTVSDILVANNVENNIATYVVTDFQTGKAIKDAEVEVYYYDYSRGSSLKLLLKGKTNNNGIFTHKATDKGNRNFIYLVRYKNSLLTTNSYYYRTVESVKTNNVKLISDRSIYRPGQTVYFKGIASEGKDNDFKVMSNVTVDFIIYDVNNEEVFKKSYKTNEYGSFDDSFVLPSSSLLGNFRMMAAVKGNKQRSNYSAHSFSVEEYKRPTYEVKLNLPKEEAKLNSDVRLTGNAKAHAGFPIANAQVVVSVYRNWNNYWRSYWPSAGSGDLLKIDTLTTDANGDFTIDFFSETDPNANKNAYYYYEIVAKVTDLSGETHEQKISLILNKIGLSLQADLPNQVFTHDKGSFLPQVVNLAGEAQSLKDKTVTIEVYRRSDKERFLNRIWENAEYNQFGTEGAKEFAKIYPYNRLDAFDAEDEYVLVNTLSYKLGASVSFEQFFQKDLKGEQGVYKFKFKASTDAGDELELEKIVSVIDVTSKKMPMNEALWTFVSSSEVEVGKDVEFQVGSSFKNAIALVSFFRGKELVSQEWVELKNRHSICYSVTEKDRGMLTYQVLLIQNGRIYTSIQNISVPYSNKKLEIIASTFRDKLEPGAKERWTFKIKDNDGQLKNVELASVMYDASLDYFRPQNWSYWLYSSSGVYLNWLTNWSTSLNGMSLNTRNYDLTFVINNSFGKYDRTNSRFKILYYTNHLIRRDGVAMEAAFSTVTREDIANLESAPRSKSAEAFGGLKDEESGQLEESSEEPTTEAPQGEMNVRSNFDETAFFYPTIYADENNDYVLNFTLPESLTKWKLLMLAHSKELEIGTLQKEIEAKKDLMITANAPRFVRQGDVFDFPAKVVNLTDKDQVVEVSLNLENPMDLSTLNWIKGEVTKSVTVPANSSVDVSWRLEIRNQDLIQYTVSVKNANFSDGERNILPVLSNRILVTETEHVLLKDKGKTEHHFTAFENNKSESLDHKSFTVEYIDNLAWQAVLALPYLSKANDMSATSLVNSYYANAIAKYIVEQNPKVQQIFNQWKAKSPEVFMSELEKNEELKNIILKETPWVMEAKSETEQRRRIGQLFELNQLQNNQENMLAELKKLQNADGGFTWFKGGKSSTYITQNVLTRLGHLSRLGVSVDHLKSMIDRAEKFVTDEKVAYYEKYIKDAKNKDNYSISSYDLNWLYARTFFNNTKSAKIDEVTEYYKAKLKKDWTKFNPYMQALIGIYFNKEGFTKERDLIYASLLDRAKKNTHIGMYWVENSGWYWYDNKIGTQAMIISFFQEMKASDKIMDDARLWLILNKEANAWETGVQTADAIYAVLLSGKNYLATSPRPTVKVGNKTLVYENTKNNNEIEVEYIEGLGQIKHRWSGSEVNSSLGKVSVEKHSDGPAVLNMYWQYEEDMTKVKASQNSSMKVQKKYYRLVPGEKAETGIEGTEFTVGDKIQIEILVTVDRDMEFVHLKDLRPAGFEPTDTRSGYRWKNGAVYYQSTKDASMEFFIEQLRKGTYKFTYTVYATHSGQFSNGMASMQSYYAPKFAGHSSVVEIQIEKQ